MKIDRSASYIVQARNSHKWTHMINRVCTTNSHTKDPTCNHHAHSIMQLLQTCISRNNCKNQCYQLTNLAYLYLPYKLALTWLIYSHIKPTLTRRALKLTSPNTKSLQSIDVILYRIVWRKWKHQTLTVIICSLHQTLFRALLTYLTTAVPAPLPLETLNSIPSRKSLHRPVHSYKTSILHQYQIHTDSHDATTQTFSQS